ncbi:MAG: dihydropteroate synthase [Burkholderiales bacterium]
MGVINVTPDSFSDGGQFVDLSHAVQHAKQLVDEGADILDIGGESTRPGSDPVLLEVERKRVLPVLERVVDLGVAISIDTYKPGLMREVISAGASMINDIFGLRTPDALEAVADSDAAVCIMHMQGDPRTMQLAPHYDDVVAEVAQFLTTQAQIAMQRGIDRSRIVLDPGFGFGKTPRHNLALVRALPALAGKGFPLVAGLSRKSLLGKITGKPAGQRVHESVAAALLAAQKGASILRVHDVAATRAALLVQQAIDNNRFTPVESK